MTKIPVTVAIPIKNESANLDRCLCALERYDEVIVIDSSSTDDSLEIAARHGVRSVNFAWNGKFPKKRNWFLDSQEIRNEWVLFLDADEVVNAAFDAELERAIAGTAHDGFWLNYTNYFLGSPLNHGVPQRKLALFRKSAGRYERIDEEGWSKLDMEVHEHPVLAGTTGEIAAKIDHRDFQGLEKFLLRHVDYAKWESRRLGAALAKIDDPDSGLTRRQKFKYANLRRSWFAWAYFFYTYIVKLGFMDGRRGFAYAFYKFWYFQTIRLFTLSGPPSEAPSKTTEKT